VAEKFVYYLGLDLGQSADYTALCVLEEPVWVGPEWKSQVPPFRSGWVSPADIAPSHLRYAIKEARRQGRPPNPPLSVRHLERYPLGTKYTAIVERVRELTDTPPLTDKPAVLLVDKTGVGAGVIDHFEHRGIRPTTITIHGGAEVTGERDRPGFKVPKRDLVSAVQVLLQTGRLKVAASLPEAETLRRELLNFRVKIDPRTAHDSYSHWREGDHDDLVLATAMACWFREWWNALMETHYARKEAEKVASDSEADVSLLRSARPQKDQTR
jgi:hypothetical protein